MFKRIATTALVFGMLAAAPPLVAQTVSCGPREALVQQLQGKFGEMRQGVGLRGSDAIFEIWSSEETGSWSIVVTRPNGVSCIVAAGQDWLTLPDTMASMDPAA
jgi:hypothetical protein